MVRPRSGCPSLSLSVSSKTQQQPPVAAPGRQRLAPRPAQPRGLSQGLQARWFPGPPSVCSPWSPSGSDAPWPTGGPAPPLAPVPLTPRNFHTCTHSLFPLVRGFRAHAPHHLSHQIRTPSVHRASRTVKIPISQKREPGSKADRLAGGGSGAKPTPALPAILPPPYSSLRTKVSLVQMELSEVQRALILSEGTFWRGLLNPLCLSLAPPSGVHAPPRPSFSTYILLSTDVRP